MTTAWTEDGQTMYYHDACVKGTDVEKHGTKVANPPRGSTTCGKCGLPLLEGDTGTWPKRYSTTRLTAEAVGW